MLFPISGSSTLLATWSARTYHKLLVWEIMKAPRALQVASKVLDPLIGKSMVLYFRKPVGGR